MGTPPPPGQVFAFFVNFFFPALALVIVCIRVAGRLVARQFAADDWLVCVAMFMSVAETVISFFFIKTNFIGIPAEKIPPHDPTEGLIWSYAVQILYNPILALVKSSVLIFLSRIFGQKDWVRRFLLWLNVVNISQMVGVFFAIILQCTPVAFNWDLTIPGGHCVDRRVLYLLTAAFNILTDILIMGLPVWIFWGLRIPKRTKIALLVIFALGLLVTITSIVRMILLVQGLFSIPIFPNSSNNVGFVISAVETNLALITASAPALRPIFRSRERGGWFARSVMATNRNNTTTTRDPEMGQKSIGWDREAMSIVNSGVGASKFGRGGSRGGRKGRSGRFHMGRGGNRSPLRGSKIKPTIVRIRSTTNGGDRAGLAELRSSPRSSEEQTMTSNGIMRVSDIQREIDGIVKDIAVAGTGRYTGAARANIPRTPPSQPPRTSPRTPPPPRTPRGTFQPPRTPRTPRTPRSPPRGATATTTTTTTPMAPMVRSRPSMETITVGATMITPLPPRPSTDGGDAVRPSRTPSQSQSQSQPRTRSRSGSQSQQSRPALLAERYYSASIYPEQGMMDSDGDDDGDDVDDRVSRYLDRRFGVVTPRSGRTPTVRGWEGSGRPF
ncbi:uncharacterized protein C8A04DRAFT_9984 [Dichotomopilus funicola]|uniref:Rhodopsin domain-containing protein n=1 Tax=Dichotomopilus funicola TaxID=1934379 RepID=A0AAN6V796_9PEZI|nr:hypothetical protein C8A04DRAFT_9984 [Dichotomopilus funicola]